MTRCNVCELVLTNSPDGECKDCKLQDRINTAMQAADDAFWAVVAKHFPEIKTGDFDPWEAFQRDDKNRRDIRHWYEGNRKEEVEA